MIKEILIALVAVVVVILIIAFAALRFLRADDSDTFDDMPDEPRKQGRAPADSQPMPASVHRNRPMRQEPTRHQQEPTRDQQPRALPRAAEGTSADERVSAGHRDRDPRPASSERRGRGADQRVPVAASRAARPARQEEPDSQVTASWETMSDIDYWAELAADKPLTTSPSAAGPAPAARRGPDPTPGRKPSDSRPAPRGDQSAQLPVRQRTQPRAAEPATQSLAALTRLSAQPPQTGQPQTGQPMLTGPRSAPRQVQPRPDQPRTAPRPAASRAPQPPAPVSYPGAQGRLPLPLDDDPLTSPSFPAVNTSDSRSYRTRQPGSQQAGSPEGGRDRGSAGYGQQAHINQPAQFPAPAVQEQGASAPSGYPVQAPAAAPVANPYGSFVGTPSPGYPDAAATGHLDGSIYGAGYTAPGQQAVPDGGWHTSGTGNGDGASYSGPSYSGPSYSGPSYSGPSYNGPSYNDPSYNGPSYNDPSYNDPSYSSTGPGGTDHRDTGGSYTGAGYHDGDYADGGYPGGYPAASFPPGGYASGAIQGNQPDPASYQPRGQYAGHYDQRAIGAPDLAYRQDGYQGYPGYRGNGQ